MKLQHTTAAVCIIWVTASVTAQVDFSQRSITQVSTESQLRGASGATSTLRVDGVAVLPGVDGDVFAIHVDTANKETFLRVNSGTGTGVKLTDQPGIIAALGSPYSGALTLVGGFVYSAAANVLYFAEDFNSVTVGEVSLIRINASSGAPSLVTRSMDLEGLNDHTILPDGTVLATRAEDGLIGTVNPASGAWTVRLTDAQLLAASPGATELPPESIAANPVGGETFIFCHDDLDLFHVPDIIETSPTVTRLTQAGLENIDMHDLAVDEDGNLFGYDVPSNSIIIVRASDGALFTFPVAEIAAQLGGGAFSATFWRGLAARTVSATQTDLFMSSADSNYGIVRVRFGVPASSVEGWQLY